MTFLQIISGENNVLIGFLSKILIKDNKNYQDAQVRTAYGMLCGTVGIVLNILLFAGKFFAERDKSPEQKAAEEVRTIYVQDLS